MMATQLSQERRGFTAYNLWLVTIGLYGMESAGNLIEIVNVIAKEEDLVQQNKLLGGL